VARPLGQAIFTEAKLWEGRRDNVLEATSLDFDDAPIKPRLIQLNFVTDELIPVEAKKMGALSGWRADGWSDGLLLFAGAGEQSRDSWIVSLERRR
jgi:hypothetical protein